MRQDKLPEDVKRLIADHITAVEQLEILLLLQSRADREWTAEMVREEMRTSERSAAARLADLEARGFLSARRNGDTVLYRFDPNSEGLRRTIEHLASAYAECRFTVIDLIFSKPIDRLRVYADAFRFRKGNDDG